MVKSNLFKIISLFFIVIASQILLSMIENQIEDRSQNRYEARAAVKKSWTGDQIILSSILIIPYKESSRTRVYDKELGRYVEKISWTKNKTFILPQRQLIASELDHQILTKGIHEVPVYTAELKTNGSFDLAKLRNLQSNPEIRLSDMAYLSFGIEDTRGITGTPSLKVNNRQLETNPGSRLDFFLSGFHASIDIKAIKENINFESKVMVKGMGRIAFIATGKENKVTVNSDWPHPSFDGAFLPTSRKISDSGYEATWQVGVFNTDMENHIQRCLENQCDNIYANSFGVDHIQAVDIYLKSLRSIKYGLLVVIVTFTLFVLYEVLNSKIRIHPISYGLTGMALAIFFLLLIALSEHINFAFSYWISSIACSSLIGYYVSHFSASKKHGLSMFGLLNAFYLILYFIIRSEDHALLSGSILLFVLLTLVIVVTRKIDWYKFGSKDVSDR
ncbi:MAG: cell envelope integrity protein CreD [Kangiellaceae bacterium]|nr:cell envelope integrity protein CreD [Kangiellaceae bacterium]